MSPVDRVQVYSSYAYAVEPRAFYFKERRHDVEEIERAWKSPGRIHFYVRDGDRAFFELVYEEANDRWFLKVFGETCRVESPSTLR